jgi:hypothetical protein
MANRENCWMCHNGQEFSYLFESAAPGSSPAGSSPASSPSAAPGGASVGTQWALVQP